MNGIKVALDVDGVICNFSQGVVERAKQLNIEFLESWEDWEYWDGHDNFSKVMKEAWKDPNFWLNLEPLNKINFTPYMYITSRPVPAEVTKQWLDKHGFPTAKVITVSKPEDKLQHLLDEKIDLLIDDLHSTVKTAIDNGIQAFLFHAPYQRGHENECKGLPKLWNLRGIEALVC
jgi:uncharacterized HAD superfamily protein